MLKPFLPSLPFKPIEPSLPLITTDEPSLPFTPIEPSTPSLPSLPFTPNVALGLKLKVTLLSVLFFVIKMLPSVLFNETVAFGFTVVALVPFALITQPAFAIAVVAFNWSKLTASVPLTPGATLIIVLPPLFKPLSVTLTVLLGSALLVIVKPLLFNVVLPIVTLPLDVKFTSLASFTFKPSVALS